MLGHYLLQLLVCTGAHAVHPHLVESLVGICQQHGNGFQVTGVDVALAVEPFVHIGLALAVAGIVYYMVEVKDWIRLCSACRIYCIASAEHSPLPDVSYLEI